MNFDTRSLTICLLAIIAASSDSPAQADTFTYTSEGGTREQVEARLVASEKGWHILELANGHYQLIPHSAVQKREVADGPKALDSAAVVAELKTRFGAARFHSFVQEPYVMGLVLAAPLPKGGENRATILLKKGARLMKSVEHAFGSFAKEARLDTNPPVRPLVVLIFETDDDFEAYATSATSGDGSSANRISGFYSGITNWLAIRLHECNSFEVPLHEAIHQQVYNRNVLQRLAPIPQWFDEGIATGFEGREGKISVSPTKISPRYSRQALQRNDLSWEQMSANDSVFHGDVLAGEAYGQAWGLHWLLVTRYKIEYGKYIRMLSQKTPMQMDSPESRMTEFQEAFKKSISEMEQEFESSLKAAAKRQKLVLDPPKPAGISKTEDRLGIVELTAVRLMDQGGRLKVEGSLTNASPLRPMSFHVTVETDSATYAEWVVHDLGISKSTPLPKQFVTKAMRNGPRDGQNHTFRVRIRSVPPDSEAAKNWKRGELPIPEYEP